MSQVRTHDLARSPSGPKPRPRIDAQTVMRIKDLVLRARVTVEGFFNGLHRSPLHGFSAEFSEYRQYTPGDDTRFVDWRLFARSDRYYIKRFEDETNRHCYLLVDLSRSMSYGSLEFTKAEYARTLAATFAYYLTLQRDCVGLITYDDQLRDYLPARHRVGHLRRLMSLLERTEQGSGTNTELALEHVARLVKKRGLIVILSDFLSSAGDLQRPLAYLRSRGHEVLALRILDPTEVSFDFGDAMTFRDFESRQAMYVNPLAVRNEYLEKFQAHDQQLRDVCTQLGIDLTRITTDQSLDRALYHWLAHQVRQAGGYAGTRRAGAGGARR